MKIIELTYEELRQLSLVICAKIEELDRSIKYLDDDDDVAIASLEQLYYFTKQRSLLKSAYTKLWQLDCDS